MTIWIELSEQAVEAAELHVAVHKSAGLEPESLVLSMASAVTVDEKTLLSSLQDEEVASERSDFGIASRFVEPGDVVEFAGGKSAPRTKGVIFVHSCPAALCQHVEWAVERVTGTPGGWVWRAQPAAPIRSMRAEVAWAGARGMGARIASALKAWPMIRFEVTEEASQGSDGERLSYVPNLGLFRVATSANGDLIVSEQQLRSLLRASSVESFRSGMSNLLGEAWDDDLQKYRSISPGSSALPPLRRIAGFSGDAS